MQLHSYRQKIIAITPAKTAGDTLHFEYENGRPLPKETITGLQGLGDILQKIHNRLVSEGYSIIEGKLYSPDGVLLYERNQSKQ
ncbi:hypothetical protein [Ferruginibacter sp.]|nr:hypothetical protein [Ferruginibacter sp.]